MLGLVACLVAVLDYVITAIVKHEVV